jgi:hypothetical protein
MGSRTPNFSLYKPDKGESGWASKVNNNFDTIDGNLTTDEAIEDVVAALLSAGSNVSLNYDDPSDTLTISATDTNTDTRTDVSDGGSQVVAEVEDIDFGSNLSVSDDGDGTVTISATDTNTDTRTDVSDSGSQVVAEVEDINAGANLSVSDDGDGTVTIDASGGGGTDVSDSGTQIVADTGDINFDSGADVTDDGDGTVTVTVIESYSGAGSLPSPSNVSQPQIAYLEAEDDYVGIFQS